MASPFSIFRKHQRPMMAVLGILCMVAFSVVGFSGWDIGSSQGGGKNELVAATTRYGDFRESDLEAMSRNRSVANRFMGTLYQIQTGFAPPTADAPFGPTDDTSLVRSRLLLELGNEMGVTISDDSINDYLRRFTDDKVRQDGFESATNQINATSVQVFAALRQELTIINVASLLESGDAATPSQRFEYYQQMNRRATIEAIPIRVVDVVEEERVPDPSEEQIQEFFEKYKDQPKAPDSPEPGFKVRDRAVFEILTAKYEDFKARAKVTEIEILKQYNEVKDTEYPHAGLAKYRLRKQEQKKLADEKKKANRRSKSKLKDHEDAEASGAEADAEGGGKKAEGKNASRKKAAVEADAAEQDGNRDADGALAEPAKEDGGAIDARRSKSQVGADNSTRTSRSDAEGLLALAEGESGGDEAADDKALAGDDALDEDVSATDEASEPKTNEAPLADDSAADDSAADDSAADDSAAEGTTSGAVDEGGGNSDEGGREDAEPESAAETQADLPGESADSDDVSANGDDAVGGEKAEAEDKSATEFKKSPFDSLDSAVDSASEDAGLNPGVRSSGPPANVDLDQYMLPPRNIVERVYQPLSEVGDRIKDKLTRERVKTAIDDAFEVVQKKLRRYAAAWARWSVDKQHLRAPAKIDFKALANENGLVFERTRLIDVLQARNVAAISQDVEAGIGSQDAYIQAVFSGLQPYQGHESRDFAQNRYFFWKTTTKSAYVPSLEKAREEVISQWKIAAGRKLARSKAESLAARARKLRNETLEDLFSKEPGVSVRHINSFSWMKQDFDFQNMYNRNQRPPRISDVPGIEMAGDEFMRTVFRLEVGQVGVAMNQNQTVAYVVRITRLDPSSTILRDLFMSMSFETYAAASANDQTDLQQAWWKGVERNAGLAWAPGRPKRRGESEY